MSSRLETLPPEILYNICEAIDKGQDYKRQHHATFVNLSLVSKTCRSHATRYVSRRLFIKKCIHSVFAIRLRDCVLTLKRLGVLHFVQGVDMSLLDCLSQTHLVYLEGAFDFLRSFPNMTHLYIEPDYLLPDGFFYRMDRLLADRCARGDTDRNRYSWWYEKSTWTSPS